MRYSHPFDYPVTRRRVRNEVVCKDLMDWRGKRRVKRNNSDEAISTMTGAVGVDARGQICCDEFKDQSIVWTNEKHNLYIESLKATFVQHLHQSIGASGRNFPGQPFANSDSSEKFLVPKDGCRKMSLPNSKPHMDKMNNKISNKQCARNVRSAGKYCGGSSPSLDCDNNIGSETISRPGQLAGHFDNHQLSRYSAALAEFSDQNFIDDQQQVTNQSLNEWQWKKT